MYQLSNFTMKKLILLSFLCLCCSFYIAAQKEIMGSWKGVMIDKAGNQQPFSMTIIVPERQEKSLFYVKQISAWIKFDNKEQRQFSGVLNHGSTSANLYQKGYDKRNGNTQNCLQKLQLVFKNGKFYGYWQDTKMVNTVEKVCKMGKIELRKDNSIKQV